MIMCKLQKHMYALTVIHTVCCVNAPNIHIKRHTHISSNKTYTYKYTEEERKRSHRVKPLIEHPVK